MKTKILVDFQICISVPLSTKFCQKKKPLKTDDETKQPPLHRD